MPLLLLLACTSTTPEPPKPAPEPPKEEAKVETKTEVAPDAEATPKPPRKIDPPKQDEASLKAQAADPSLAALSDGPVTASPAIDMAMAGPAVRAWNALITAGCDPKGTMTHVWTPVEARILRNVPYAMRGYTFSSRELDVFFTRAERNWYEAHTKDVKLPEEARACVDRLKAHEDELRKEWPVAPTVERRLVSEPVVFEAYWTWGHASADKYYDLVKVEAISNGALTVEALAPGCEPEAECSAYVIQCESGQECVAVAAG
jgi:hypothetical protein